MASQDSRFEEFHTWFDARTIYNFSARLRYDGDFGTRGGITDPYWTAFFVQPSLRYQSRAWWTLHGGAAFFYNSFQDEEDVRELRPWAGARFVWPRLGGFTVSHYFRFEYRAFYIDHEWTASGRGRYQLQLRSPTFAVGRADRFHALASVEVFGDLDPFIDGSFGDRYRLTAGVGKQVTHALQVQFNYFFHKVRLSAARGDLEVDDHVVRLRLAYNFN